MEATAQQSTSPNAPTTGSGAGEGAAGSDASSKKALLTITPEAAAFAKTKLDKRGTPEAAIRLGIKGGGCSGFSYVIAFADDEPRARDRVFEQDGIRFYVDKKSLIYLQGSVLDYERTLMFQGFKFKNPQEAASCGCGHSFTVK